MDVVVVVLKSVIVINFLLAVRYSTKNYRRTQSHAWLFLSMSMGTAFLLSSIRLVKEFFYFQFNSYQSVITTLELVKINLIPFVTAFLLAAAITISRERIAAVIPMGKAEKAPPYNMERGTTYLVCEEPPQKVYHLFLDLLSAGYRGLAILRTHPDEVREKYDIKDVPILWLSRLQVGVHTVYPNTAVIEQIIEDFCEGSQNQVILLERLDYLISQQGFEKTLQFIQKLSSLIYVRKSIALLHIDPLTIGERELILIEKETKRFKREHAELGEELLEVLHYVYDKNRRGIKPNLKQVTKDLSLSRNTAKKRINALRLQNLLVLKTKGRQKIVEITRIGEEFIH